MMQGQLNLRAVPARNVGDLLLVQVGSSFVNRLIPCNFNVRKLEAIKDIGRRIRNS